jgi:hypothetical protein
MKALCRSLGLTPADLHIRVGKHRYIRAFSALWYLVNALRMLLLGFSFWAFTVAIITIFG